MKMIRKIRRWIKKRFEHWQDMDVVKKEVQDARKGAPHHCWRETPMVWRFCKKEQETKLEYQKRIALHETMFERYGKEKMKGTCRCPWSWHDKTCSLNHLNQ